MTYFKSAALFTVLGFLLASLAGSLRAAPDQMLGMALMSARVDENGAPVAGSGVVTATRHAPGSYTVIFVRSVIGCVAVASPGTIGAGRPHIFPYSGDERGFQVAVRSSAGSLVDNDFNVIVFCAK